MFEPTERKTTLEEQLVDIQDALEKDTSTTFICLVNNEAALALYTKIGFKIESIKNIH
ncbi:hypothetical protein GCM10007140_00790 [Priestia taiwanensis]|uniref:Acetyltransferase n=1 Tax=Priestia taiwanensis TaxID=1347902 RepID=A0A917AHS1_9BACI|nr:hypothetical protein GCM10007140_00790 [Priestia taiwanensis]